MPYTVNIRRPLPKPAG